MYKRKRSIEEQSVVLEVSPKSPILLTIKQLQLMHSGTFFMLVLLLTSLKFSLYETL